MERVVYVGLDVHKKWIAFCVKEADGSIVAQGQVEATRRALYQWAQSFERPWQGAMEATMFTGWIYDALRPYAQALKVANPLMLRAIAASKKKNDRIDAQKIADALRCDLLPECYMAPQAIRELRRVLRFRNFLVRTATRLKNRTSGLLMECGVEFEVERVHQKRYFRDLLGRLEEVPESVLEMLRFNRNMLDVFTGTQQRLLDALTKNRLLRERMENLTSIHGVGQVLGLTWALEVGEPDRFASIRRAVSYCGLCSAQVESAGKQHRGPLSKQRNEHLQWVLVEAAKMAPRWNPQLADYHAAQLERGSRNRATLAVARKLVAYLLAVDKQQKPFLTKEEPKTPQ